MTNLSGAVSPTKDVVEVQGVEYHVTSAPCLNFVEHPHIVDGQGCYTCRSSSSALGETNSIAVALAKEGIECHVAQTGGFCMVVYVVSEDKTRAIGANAECVVFESDWQEGGEDQETLLASTDWDGGDLTPEQVAEIVEVFKSNLYRLEVTK